MPADVFRLVGGRDTGANGSGARTIVDLAFGVGTAPDSGKDDALAVIFGAGVGLAVEAVFGLGMVTGWDKAICCVEGTHFRAVGFLYRAAFDGASIWQPGW
jgi:hypothetical protein